MTRFLAGNPWRFADFRAAALPLTLTAFLGMPLTRDSPTGFTAAVAEAGRLASFGRTILEHHFDFRGRGIWAGGLGGWKT